MDRFQKNQWQICKCEKDFLNEVKLSSCAVVVMLSLPFFICKSNNWKICMYVELSKPYIYSFIHIFIYFAYILQFMLVEFSLHANDRKKCPIIYIALSHLYLGRTRFTKLCKEMRLEDPNIYIYPVRSGNVHRAVICHFQKVGIARLSLGTRCFGATIRTLQSAYLRGPVKLFCTLITTSVEVNLFNSMSAAPIEIRGFGTYK